MNPNARVNPVVLFGIWQSPVELFRTGTSSDSEKDVHTRLASTLQHGVAIFGELREVNMCVRVDEVHVDVAATAAKASAAISSVRQPRRPPGSLRVPDGPLARPR